MTGLAVTACKQATVVGPVGSGIEAPDRTLLSFQRPLRTREGTPPASGRRIRRDQPVYLPDGDLASPAPERPRESSRRPSARLSAAAGGGACRPGAPRRRGSRPAGRASPRPPARPSTLTPPWPISRRASLDERPNSLAIRAGRCTDRRRARSSSASSISSGSSRRTWMRSKRASASAPAPVAVEAVDEPARELALGLVRVALRIERRAEQEQVVLGHDLVRDAHQLPEHLVGRVGDRRRSCRTTCSSCGRRRCPAGSASSGSTAAPCRRRSGRRARTAG